MQTAKTDQTGQMPRLIWVFAMRTGHFVGFVMLQLICLTQQAGFHMQISYQIRDDIYKYFVNARSIRFKFKCLYATCPVLRIYLFVLRLNVPVNNFSVMSGRLY